MVKYIFVLIFVIIFVVLDISKTNQDATNITKRTETKIRGKRTVASTAVLSRHRFEVSSSDFPFFYNNQNINVMLDTKGQTISGGNAVAPANGVSLNGQAQQSLNDVMSHALPEIIKSHKENRHGVFKGLLGMHRNELTLNCMVEMDAKNEAYYFIISQGLCELFKEYCTLRKEGVLA